MMRFILMLMLMAIFATSAMADYPPIQPSGPPSPTYSGTTAGHRYSFYTRTYATTRGIKYIVISAMRDNGPWQRRVILESDLAIGAEFAHGINDKFWNPIKAITSWVKHLEDVIQGWIKVAKPAWTDLTNIVGDLKKFIQDGSSLLQAIIASAEGKDATGATVAAYVTAAVKSQGVTEVKVDLGISAAILAAPSGASVIYDAILALPQ